MPTDMPAIGQKCYNFYLFDLRDEHSEGAGEFSTFTFRCCLAIQILRNGALKLSSIYVKNSVNGNNLWRLYFTFLLVILWRKNFLTKRMSS